jgi:hypothetical protein
MPQAADALATEAPVSASSMETFTQLRRSSSTRAWHIDRNDTSRIKKWHSPISARSMASVSMSAGSGGSAGRSSASSGSS